MPMNHWSFVNMLWLISKLCEIVLGRNVKLAAECSWFHKYRSYSDGITFFNVNIDSHIFIEDHMPKFEFEVVIMNHITQFEMYNIYHVNSQGIVDKDIIECNKRIKETEPSPFDMISKEKATSPFDCMGEGFDMMSIGGGE